MHDGRGRPSTPPEFDHGFMNAISVVAERLGRTLPDFLGDVDAVLHGCTAGLVRDDAVHLYAALCQVHY